MKPSGLDALFSPRSVAAIGVSRRRGSIGAEIFHNLLTGGFTGPVFPVNLTEDSVHSVKAYKRIGDISEAVDLAIIATPPTRVLDIVDECARKGVAGIVVIAGGFAETGADGASIQKQIVERCRSAGIRLMGPNCLGVLNTDGAVRMNATFAAASPSPGSLAFASQSGALGLAAIDYASELGVGLCEFASMGNKADVSGNDLIERWRSDPRARVILLYLEGFGNPRRFLELARAVSLEKPIIVVKAGRTKVGALAASSHTAALADSEAAVGALLAQTGVIRVDTMRELFDVAVLLSQQPVPAGRRVAILTNAGGLGIMAADACEAQRLALPPPSDATKTTMRSFLPSNAALANPVDLIATASGDTYEKAVRAALADPAFDAVLVLMVPTAVTNPNEIATGVVRAAADAKKPIVCSVTGVHGVAEAVATLRRNGIPAFHYPEDAVIALGKAVNYGAWKVRQRREATALTNIDRDLGRQLVKRAIARLRSSQTDQSNAWLLPDELQTLLGAYGIEMPKSSVVTSIDAAVAAAEKIGYPAVLKVTSKSIVHKTEVGGVRLGLRDSDSVRAACLAMQDRMGGVVDGFVVQQMIDGGTELFAGMTRNPDFGALIGFGVGGVQAELFHDINFRLAPLSLSDADDLPEALHAQALLDGFRGHPRVDRAAVAQVLLRISALVEDFPQILELDINPLVATAHGELIALDARARLLISESFDSPTENP